MPARTRSRAGQASPKASLTKKLDTVAKKIAKTPTNRKNVATLKRAVSKSPRGSPKGSPKGKNALLNTVAQVAATVPQTAAVVNAEEKVVAAIKHKAPRKTKARKSPKHKRAAGEKKPRRKTRKHHGYLRTYFKHHKYRTGHKALTSMDLVIMSMVTDICNEAHAIMAKEERVRMSGSIARTAINLATPTHIGVNHGIAPANSFAMRAARRMVIANGFGKTVYERRDKKTKEMRKLEHPVKVTQDITKIALRTIASFIEMTIIEFKDHIRDIMLEPRYKNRKTITRKLFHHSLHRRHYKDSNASYLDNSSSAKFFRHHFRHY